MKNQEKSNAPQTSRLSIPPCSSLQCDTQKQIHNELTGIQTPHHFGRTPTNNTSDTHQDQTKDGFFTENTEAQDEEISTHKNVYQTNDAPIIK